MKVDLKTDLPNGANQTIVLDVVDPNVSQKFGLEYVSQADGGPLMRPTNPPK